PNVGSGTGSMPERARWPWRRYWVDVAWAAFGVANLVAMLLLPEWETVPFHFIWVSLTLLYGFRVWRVRPTVLTLAVVMVSTGLLIAVDVARGAQPVDEIAEVPLMAAMFVAMMWHAQRRLVAMEEAKRVSAENLRLLERERRFVQDASHELRTPITVALGHAQLISRTTQDPKLRQDAELIADELMRLRRLADRLLVLAGREDPGFLQTTAIDVESFVVDVFHRWAAMPRRWCLGDLEEAMVQADPERLAVALDALLENAVKYSAPGDSITLSARTEGRNVVIGVRDSGVGIPPEDLERVFNRFARAGNGRSRGTGGFGLGLSIVKAVAEAHGGSVPEPAGRRQPVRDRASCIRRPRTSPAPHHCVRPRGLLRRRVLRGACGAAEGEGPTAPGPVPWDHGRAGAPYVARVGPRARATRRTAERHPARRSARADRDGG